MKKVAIVGVEGSGKTVMLAGLGDLYTYPDEEGYLLVPKNFSTAAYVAEKIERMRKGEWPAATADDVMEGLDWTLKRRIQDGRQRPETICEVSFLDFAGEVYRTAFGVGAGNASLAEQAEELKRYVREADDLLVLINLRDVIVHGIRDRRVQEAMWITKAILDAALAEESGRKAPRAAIVLSQADSYADTIKECGGAQGVLRKHLPYVAYDYEWLDVFAASAVDKTKLDDDGNAVPAEDFTSKGLLPIMTWIRGEEVSDGGGRGATALPRNASKKVIRLRRPDDQASGVFGGATALPRDASKKVIRLRRADDQAGGVFGGTTALPRDASKKVIRLRRADDHAGGEFGGATALPRDAAEKVIRLGRPGDQASGVFGGAKAVNRVQLWEGGPYWADRNIGAELPWEPGYYFWWGDTVGYKRENGAWVASDGSLPNFQFNEDNEIRGIRQTFGKSNSTLRSEGWITADTVLAPEHDAAQVQWGGGWRMPTKQELDDLCNMCDWIWTTPSGVNGYVVRGRGGYASARIFLPCAGYGCGLSLDNVGSYGYYWSSVPYSDTWYLLFNSSCHDTYYNNRYYGYPVRPVQGFTK